MNVAPTKVFIPTDDFDAIFEDMRACFSSGMLTLGNFTKRFEAELSQHVASRPVVAVSSGTSALEIAGLSLGLDNGAEVIVPSNTFVATAIAFARIGAHVRFTDCDPVFGSITLDEVKRLHTDQTRAVVIVHIGGIVAPDTFAIRDYCQENNLYLIEDAAHALGSNLNNTPAGAIGDMGTFSFYPTKVVTSGEGGAIIVSQESHIKECHIYRDQGKQDFLTNLHTRRGSNWRLSEIHAITGYYQVKRLHEFIDAREKVASAYKHVLHSDKLQVVFPEGNSVSNWYKVMALLPEGVDRDSFKNRLAERGVRCGGEVYQVPCHQQPIFVNEAEGSLPKTETFTRSHICLPVSAVMTEAETAHVCEVVKDELTKI